MILYTGRSVKSAEFDYKYVGLKKATDKEGPGFYFSTNIDTAFAYAKQGIVITVEVDTKNFLTKKNKPKLNVVKKLILSAPDLEDTLSNFAEDYNKALRLAIESYMDYDTALDSYQTICNDFYRYEPVKYLEQLIKLGYNGHFGEEFKKSQFVEESQFVIVYNNKIIKVLDVQSAEGINESKKLINKILKESEEILDEIVVHGLGYGLIHEIGDATTKSFNFKIDQKSDVIFKYLFTTDEDVQYKVVFENERLGDRGADDNWHLAFGDVHGLSFKTDTVVNKGEVFKVMATIINIMKDFIRKNKKNIDRIIFKGTDSRRDNMYAQYVLKNFANEWNIGQNKSDGFVLIPKQRYVYK